MRQIAERGKEIFHPLDNAVHEIFWKLFISTIPSALFANFYQVYANVIYIYNTKDTSYETTSHGESNGICLSF